MSLGWSSAEPRDGVCLLTDAIFTDCTASHIVPYSRPHVSFCLPFDLDPLIISYQLYQRILDLPFEPPLFEPSAGLLLREDMHHAFDRLEWSLYHCVRSLLFNPEYFMS